MTADLLRPLWLLDMDGAFHSPLDGTYSGAPWDDFAEVNVPRPGDAGVRILRFAPAVLAVVRDALAAGVEVRWHSSWRDGTVGVAEALGLPPVDYSPLADDDGPGWVKLREARALAGERPLLWVDDDLRDDRDAIAWLEGRSAPTAWIIPPSWMFGMRPGDVRAARAWVAAVTA